MSAEVSETESCTETWQLTNVKQKGTKLVNLLLTGFVRVCLKIGYPEILWFIII